MPRDKREVDAGLASKGFAQRPGDHDFFIYIGLDGKKSMAKTKTSHGRGEIDDRLLSLMARQCGLTKKQFLDLVDCPMTREQLEELLKHCGKI